MVVQEREQAFARRTITTADLAEWPDARLDGGGRMEDTRVFIGSSTIESQPLRTKRLVFTDPQDPSLACAHSAVSADGKLLAASFGSNDVLVWRLSDGLLVQRLGHDHGHTDRIFALAFSPVDPCTLVSGSKDTTALVWDTRRARVLQRLEGHRGPVSSIAYAPDGALIATGSHGDTSVKLWAPALGACLHTFDVGAGMYTLAFSADNTRLAVALGRSGLLYDLRTHARVATLQHASTEVLYWALDSAAGADADARVATAPGLQNPGEVKLWSAHTGAPLRTIAHPPHGLSMPVAFAPDGSEVLAACNAECTALAFDARTGALRRTFRAAKRVYRVAYSPDGAYVAFGAADGDVEVHDAASGVFLGRFDGREGSRELWEVQFLADGQSLLARFKYGPLLLYNVQDVLRIR
ncbi:uncharacterized protein PHACADRAFT_253758 [Phanerochaete carnosa HHB-10118-sp]|uniref:Uncharacterized protein n=1 Tax=Phanerochaete carnosa (strain HHB-10118-sp) TaxID=650164 RepID=K5WC40_PHACS|nr:uncharacterized protein PHACADRAFT_253758 [Phanerochaete carnosa HHB-10118-sp]EKM56559.1 hypothetical protein PHACADRAFT_253758 [Phanerochaete carnosa HHB-10118-sp]